MTLFIDNKYTRWYFDIIQNAQNRATTRKKAKEILGYVETHHIIPVSLGGSNFSINKVHLTAREHFICHRLLTKMTHGISRAKMRKAVHKMCSSNKFQERGTVTSRTYEVIRREFKQAWIDTCPDRGGENNGMFGKTHSEESLQLMKANRRGKGTGKRGPCERLSEVQKNVPKSESHKLAIKESWVRTRDSRTGENHPSYGLKRSEESRAKMKAAWERRRQAKALNT